MLRSSGTDRIGRYPVLLAKLILERLALLNEPYMGAAGAETGDIGRGGGGGSGFRSRSASLPDETLEMEPFRRNEPCVELAPLIDMDMLDLDRGTG